MTDTPVLIVGAGPTGLVLALRLARHGIACRIIDRNQGPGQASRALGVHARTLEFYQQLGFADIVVAQGIRVNIMHLREHGVDVARLTLAEMGAGLSPFPFLLSYAQDDHERLLVELLRAAGVTIDWAVELEAFTQTDSGVQASLIDRNGTRQVCAAEYLCGCDGARSAVREQLGIGFPGGTYQQRFYVADVGIDAVGSRDAFVSLDLSGFALMMPVRGGGAQRIVGIVPAHLTNSETLEFSDVQPSAEALLGIHVESVNWFSVYHVHHRVAEHFHRDRCFLLGDAGHVHSPLGGQGMNTGIGDAVNLSWKLAQVLTGRAKSSLLDSYEPERIVFARLLVQTTDRAFQNLVNPGRGGRFLRTWLVPRLMPFLTGFSTVRRMMFRAISQIRINYRNTALCQGIAGEVHGGDRLPYVTDHNGDNFAPLQSMDWQIHIYGTPRPDFTTVAVSLRLPIHAFAWNDAADDAGLLRDAAYLIRPDGYVALAMPAQTGEGAAQLSNYVASVFSS
jgi:2-polyprenyl-6-methoxyphenol hydroxylase-like FAD-dependent oxidoreductase